MKTVLVWVSLLGFISGYAQVSRFRAIKSSIAIIKERNESDKLTWVDDDALIVVNHNNKTIRVFGHKNVVFSWFKATFTDTNKLDVRTKATAVYDSIDPDGGECNIQFDIFKPHYVSMNALIYFRYRNYILTYAANIVN